MMVDNNDWESAYRDAIDRGRARVDPPTPDELVAWSRGELPPSEEDRMRERLAYYPDLAAALAEDDEDADDEPPLLTREQIATDWELIRQRLHPPGGLRVPAELVATPPRRSHWATIVPVVTTLLLAALFVRSRLTIDELRTQLDSPRENVERIELHATVPRGPASARPIVLQPSTQYLVLALNVTDDIRSDRFHVEIRDLDTEPPATVWKSSITRGSDGAFSIVIPRDFLTRQAYQIDLFSSTGAEPIATYIIWISGSRRPRGTS